ncbi:ribonuclease HIII [Sediminibacillus halophilus]|uniref:Ribonuclease HIII n=1 Tax=Sediminibacillus halophilus TaxID=482461 RepID=A0A1G9XIX6_9BACI|nr:ribonuclease HIII [Sediminibacillus halophilus]
MYPTGNGEIDLPQVVLKLNNKTIEKMKVFYRDRLKSAPPGSVFAAKTSDCSITAYNSGKVLFQGKGSDKEAGKWGIVNKDNPSKTKQTTRKIHSYSPPQKLFTSSHIGSDEAGTGDFFGPITVAAAYVTADQIPFLKQLGVRDSKNLTDEKIETIAKALLAHSIPYSLVVLRNEKYNHLQKKGWSQGKMKTMLHHHALEKLSNKIAPERPEGILIDQFSDPGVYINHLKSERSVLQENVYFMTKAESYSIAVAAGSILARASFVNEMNKLSKKMGIELPKGASQKVDQTAAGIIQKHGKQALGEIAKLHFANTKKAEAYTQKDY